MKTVYLVLGAQRSGTSVTSHMLSQFGIHFGNADHFLQAEHNPNFFELQWVNQYNDRLLQQLGYRYTDFFLPIETDYHQPFIWDMATKLPALIAQEWQDAQPIGIKDPRFSLTFPIWRQVLQNQGYDLKLIFVFRSPSTFLRSNQQLLRNWAGWDEKRHLYFWLQLNLAALYFTREFSLHYIQYEQLMQQPLKVAEALATRFDLDRRQISAAASVVDRTYYHHQQSTQTGHPFIDRSYQLLCAHALSASEYLRLRDRS